MELARWTPYAMASVPKRVPVSSADDAIIRRKLMFEAGNPPASSHRGIKLLMGSVGIFTTAVREQRNFEEIEPLFQRIQLFLRQEELTLARLSVCGESMRKNTEADARFPDEVAAAIEDVKNQITSQQKKLELASKTEARFKEYLDMAGSIRKLQSYDELLKSRDDLREETNKLKEEKESLDRQQADKYPFLVIANWALNNVRFESKKQDSGKAKIRVVSATVSKEHSRRDPVRHRKSPKKSSKETRNSEK